MLRLILDQRFELDEVFVCALSGNGRIEKLSAASRDFDGVIRTWLEVYDAQSRTIRDCPPDYPLLRDLPYDLNHSTIRARSQPVPADQLRQARQEPEIS
jgi:hypothetical protein